MGRLLQDVAAPLLIALPPLFWVAQATWRASLTPLGRDQGIFQYIAWALGRGAVDYRDIRDVNGPLVHLVHLVFLHLGGADEHRFRVLDLVVTGVTFAVAGACVPGLSERTPAPRALERAAWAFAGWVVLSEQYLLYGYWDLAQRESFVDWFILPSVALQVAAQGRRNRAGAARQRCLRSRLLTVAGALSVIAWFGKPVCVLVTLVQLATLLVDSEPSCSPEKRRTWARRRQAATEHGLAFEHSPTGSLSRSFEHEEAPSGDPPRSRENASEGIGPNDDCRRGYRRGRALLAFAVGGGLAAASQLAIVAILGDLAAFVHIELVDVPSMYRFIWSRSAADVFSRPWQTSQAAFALFGAVAALSLIAPGEMPRRVLVVALLPLAGIASVVVQAKGFPYHFHPVTAGVHFEWLVFAAWSVERARAMRRGPALLRLAPLGVCAALALHVSTAIQDSPHVRAAWLPRAASTPAARRSREYFAHFPERDYFPWEMRQTAAYLRKHTDPLDRVQTYGMDPYLLFLAERESATPYIYAYDLNADAALAGGTGARPNAAQIAHIRAIRQEHESDLLARLAAHPPAAFVFFDGAPLLSETGAWDDFASHSSRAAAWVEEHYVETARFRHDHIWMRKDLAQARR